MIDWTSPSGYHHQHLLDSLPETIWYLVVSRHYQLLSLYERTRHERERPRGVLCVRASEPSTPGASEANTPIRPRRLFAFGGRLSIDFLWSRPENSTFQLKRLFILCESHCILLWAWSHRLLRFRCYKQLTWSSIQPYWFQLPIK